MKTVKRKKRSVFFICYIIFFLALLISVGIGLRFLWLALNDYESTMPVYVMARARDEFANKNYSDILEQSGSSLSEFESKDFFNEYMTNKIADKEIEFVKKSGSSSTFPTYILSAGETNLATISLKEKTDKSKFGFKQYEVDLITDVISFDEEITIIAPSNATVFLNDIEVTEKWIVENNIEITKLKNVIEKLTEKPTLVKYKITGLISKPKINAIGFLENECEIIIDEEKKIAIASQNGNMEMIQKHEQLAIEVAKVYANFTSNDTEFSNLSKYLLKGMPLYRNLSILDVNFYSQHDSFEFKNVETSNFLMYNDSCFSCEIKFDYCINRIAQNKNFVFPSDITLYFIKSDGNWLVGDLTLN